MENHRNRIFISATSLVIILLVSVAISAIFAVLDFLKGQLPLKNFLLGEMIFAVTVAAAIYFLKKGFFKK